jgi:hypothetical protein
MVLPNPCRLLVAVSACALALACLPVTAVAAASAPTLVRPAVKAAPGIEGGSMKFEWAGALQGDPAAIDRSFFRVEVIASANMPAGAQTEWPANKIENFAQTPPGQVVTTASMGVPSAGEYRWRVCSWGVADVVVTNSIQQLDGGCSASRVFTTVAATTTNQIPGELRIEERRQVSGAIQTVFVDAPAQSQPADVAPQMPAEPAPAVGAPREPVEEEVPPARFEDAGRASTAGGGAALDGLEGLDPASDRQGLTGAIVGVLGVTLPFVPIPFWTLALLLACVPILRSWRRSVLGMFDWPDGSIDGHGTMANVHGELALVPVASEVKQRSMTADGVAPAPAPSSPPDAPGRGRHAA